MHAKREHGSLVAEEEGGGLENELPPPCKEVEGIPIIAGRIPLFLKEGLCRWGRFGQGYIFAKCIPFFCCCWLSQKSKLFLSPAPLLLLESCVDPFSRNPRPVVLLCC